MSEVPGLDCQSSNLDSITLTWHGRARRYRRYRVEYKLAHEVRKSTRVDSSRELLHRQKYVLVKDPQGEKILFVHAFTKTGRHPDRVEDDATHQ